MRVYWCNNCLKQIDTCGNKISICEYCKSKNLEETTHLLNLFDDEECLKCFGDLKFIKEIKKYKVFEYQCKICKKRWFTSWDNHSMIRDNEE